MAGLKQSNIDKAKAAAFAAALEQYDVEIDLRTDLQLIGNELWVYIPIEGGGKRLTDVGVVVK